MSAGPVYTIGHSTRTQEEFLDLLKASEISCVIDVRTIPASRKFPQFNKARLELELPADSIGYEHIPELGGRRNKSDRPADLNGFWRNQSFHNYADYALTDSFEAGLDSLLRICSQSVCAVMCAEAVWWRCHRRIITDYLLDRGVEVRHILGPNQIRQASMTPGAENTRGNRLIYPASSAKAALFD